VHDSDCDQEIKIEIEHPFKNEIFKTNCLPLQSSENKRSEDKDNETFQVMKTFNENIAKNLQTIVANNISRSGQGFEEPVNKRDEYDVFGENVACKMRNSGKSRYEISIAQHKVNEILFNLEMGYFDQSFSHCPNHT
ncbi:unnamed protein product, partial [Meganyctiphanes norvegica]